VQPVIEIEPPKPDVLSLRLVDDHWLSLVLALIEPP
jgi:hypothetical protein